MTIETEEKRKGRERKRRIFDRAAERYDATRSGYPEELVSRMIRVAGLSPGDRVLEIGCGTGQLTRELFNHGVEITAIDIGASMIEVARRHLPDRKVEFCATAFEEFQSVDARFSLIVSATAFHWVDPQIGWAKCARLLRSGGWLALLSTGEKYDDPVGSKLRDLYIRNTTGSAAWALKPSQEEMERQERSKDICERWSGKPCPNQGLFGPAKSASHSARRTMAAESVVPLELTRATPLGYAQSKREAFTRELREILASRLEVNLTQESTLVMAEVVSDLDPSEVSYLMSAVEPDGVENAAKPRP